MLNVETVVGFGPQWEEDCSVEDTWKREREVVVFEEIGAYPKQKNARDWAEEDADSGGGIVQETCINISNSECEKTWRTAVPQA